MEREKKYDGQINNFIFRIFFFKGKICLFSCLQIYFFLILSTFFLSEERCGKIFFHLLFVFSFSLSYSLSFFFFHFTFFSFFFIIFFLVDAFVKNMAKKKSVKMKCIANAILAIRSFFFFKVT